MEAIGRIYIVYPSRSTRISIANIADVHFGNRGCNMGRFRDDVRAIKNDPNAFWFGGGDFADYIAPNDKRWDPSTIDPDIRVSDLGQLGHVLCAKMRDEFKPISNKCLGLLFGNHEDKYMKLKDQQQLHQWLCTELGALNLGYCGFVDLIFVRSSRVREPRMFKGVNPFAADSHDSYTLRFFLHHGFSGASTPGGKLNTLVKAMTIFEADCYMLGHVHDQKGQRNVRIGANADCTALVDRQSIGVITGSYLMTYAQGSTSYGEMKGYGATPLGCVKITVEPQKHKFSAEV